MPSRLDGEASKRDQNNHLDRRLEPGLWRRRLTLGSSQLRASSASAPQSLGRRQPTWEENPFSRVRRPQSASPYLDLKRRGCREVAQQSHSSHLAQNNLCDMAVTTTVLPTVAASGCWSSSCILGSGRSGHDRRYLAVSARARSLSNNLSFPPKSPSKGLPRGTDPPFGRRKLWSSYKKNT